MLTVECQERVVCARDDDSNEQIMSSEPFAKRARRRRQRNPPKAKSLTSRHLFDGHSASATHKLRLHNFRRWFACQLLPFTALLLIIYSAGCIPVSEAVDCFKCSSRNGSNPACEDPFHNLNTTRVMTPVLPEPHPNIIYHTPCYAGKKGRDGLFPASACIKLTGIFDTTGESLVVRHCALDSGSLTQDTELARMSHCGKFSFEGDLLRGCVLACPEDACNAAVAANKLSSLSTLIVWLLTSLSICFAVL